MLFGITVLPGISAPPLICHVILRLHFPICEVGCRHHSVVILRCSKLVYIICLAAHLEKAHLIVLSRSPSQEDAADSSHFVARAAVASGRPELHDMAEQYFQDSMTHLKDSEGVGRAKFLSIQDEFCHFLQVTGQKERAISILRESLEAKVAAFGDFSPEVAETYQLLGGADLVQGNHSGAHKKLKKCLQIQMLLYGPQDKRTLATQQSIDSLSKVPEVAGKPRQSPKAKVAFCTTVPQHSVVGKARPNMAD